MAINAEWIVNKAKQKIYAISHAKAVVRNNSTVDADLTALEKSVEEIEKEVKNLSGENTDFEEIDKHLTALLTTEDGVHGLRYYEDQLQFNNGEEWVTIETSSGDTGLAPSSMKSVSVSYGLDGTKLVLKGSDPDDTVLEDGSELVYWQGTKIVRKVGSYPENVNDGTLVVDYQVRDQYATTGYVDDGLVEGVTYYYRWFPYSTSGAVNLAPDETKNRACLAPSGYRVVGIICDWANNTYTRTDKAEGQSAGAFFDEYKMFGKRRRCIVADDKTILAFYGDDAYTETGKLTVAVTKNNKTYAVGTSAQVMVYQPKFYYKVTPLTKVTNPYGTGYMIRKAQYQVADIQYDGFSVHPEFVRDGKEIPYILLSAYEASTQNSSNTYITTNASLGNRLASIANAKPATGSDGSNTHSFTRAVARGLAVARGSGWQLGDGLTASASQLLATIEYGTMELQTAIGRGNVDQSGSYSYVLATGGTASLGNGTGKAAGGTDGKCSVSYRGEENLWGNVWTCQDGMNVYNNSTGILYWADHGFADDTTASPYKSTGFNFARGNGYISAFGYSEDCDFMFIPCEVSGDSANPVGDYFYQNYSSSSMTVAFLGGGCGYASVAGLFDWYVDIASSSSDWVIGSRLVCVPDADAEEE